MKSALKWEKGTLLNNNETIQSSLSAQGTQLSKLEKCKLPCNKCNIDSLWSTKVTSCTSSYQFVHSSPTHLFRCNNCRLTGKYNMIDLHKEKNWDNPGWGIPVHILWAWKLSSISRLTRSGHSENITKLAFFLLVLNFRELVCEIHPSSLS